MRTETRKHKHKADYGITDYRNFYKDKYDVEIDAKTYSKILRAFNNSLMDLIINKSMSYTLPYLLFEISVKKVRRKPRIVDGKLINPNPINWKATNELWETNEEARNNKLLIRYNNSHTSGYVYRIYCKKFKSKIKYRSYYKMRTNRKFKNKLKKRILDPDLDNYDAFLLYKTD